MSALLISTVYMVVCTTYQHCMPGYLHSLSALYIRMSALLINTVYMNVCTTNQHCNHACPRDLSALLAWMSALLISTVYMDASTTLDASTCISLHPSNWLVLVQPRETRPDMT